MAVRKTKKRTRARIGSTNAESKINWSEFGLRWDPDELRNRRRIDRDALDDELEQQAELYGDAAEAAAVAKSIVEKLEEDIKNLDAELDSEIRTDAETNSERVTENYIKAQIAGSTDRKKLVRKLLQAKEARSRLEALSSSLKQRSYLLRDLVELYLNGYYAESSAKGSESARKDYKVDRNLDKYKERKRSRTKSRRESMPRRKQ